MTHWPETFRRLFVAPETGVCCLVPETMTHLAGKYYRQKKNRWIPILQKFVFFVFFYELKKLSSLHFIFYFCLQTNKRLLRLTNHSSAFQPVSGTKLNMLYPAPVSGTRKVWRTDQFLVPAC